METTPVKKSIEVQPDGRRLLMRIGFRNVSSQDIWILKQPPVVLIKLNGEKVDYIGPMEKRGALTIADYERVPPGHQVERVVDLAPLYAWRPGTHTYTVWLSGDYVDMDKKLFKGPPVEARFTWAA